MPAIIEFPTVVEEVLSQYREVFGTEAARRHFAEYLTGLMIAEHKTVSGLNREFAVTTDQSCLNRWLTQVEWDVAELNRQRLALRQQDVNTRYTQHGVIAIDNTLIDHEGKLIADVGWFWDHADKRHLIAHDYLIANYVCASGKHSPLDFRRFRKREQCEATGEPFKNHTALCLELIDWVVAEGIPGDLTFDSYFTNVETLNHIHRFKRSYVGDLKFNRKLIVEGKEIKASEWVKTLRSWERTKTLSGGEAQWFFTKTIRLPGVEHKVRIVVLWKQREDPTPVKILVTNNTWWETHRVLRTYRHRWSGTEPFHRDGKQHLGMGDCQLRSAIGHTRPRPLVFVAYSTLLPHLRAPRAEEWALARLMTIGEVCRSLLRQSLGSTIAWVVQQTLNGRSLSDIKAHLALL
ncbi:MAG: IS701 family transposase [Ardenticatenaceae bacterium]|nr:IS701 family transposase [Ardenticatenaceae bacterium]